MPMVMLSLINGLFQMCITGNYRNTPIFFKHGQFYILNMFYTVLAHCLIQFISRYPYPTQHIEIRFTFVYQHFWFLLHDFL